MITTLPEYMIHSKSFKSSPAVLPFSSNVLGGLDVVDPSLLQAQWNTYCLKAHSTLNDIHYQMDEACEAHTSSLGKSIDWSTPTWTHLDK